MYFRRSTMGYAATIVFGESQMGLEVEATYENGVLKLDKPLPLDEHARVVVSIQAKSDVAAHGTGIRQSAGLIPWQGDPDALAYLLGPDNEP